MAGAAKGSVKKRHADGTDGKSKNDAKSATSTARTEKSVKPPKSVKAPESNTSSSGKATSSAKSPGSQCSPKRSVRAFDGNRDPADNGNAPAPAPAPGMDRSLNLRNLDLGMGMWATIHGSDRAALPPRPKPSTLGQATRTGLNTYNVTCLPTNKVQQYEVLIGNGAEKRPLVQKVWRSKEVSKALGGGFIFDGNRLAWSAKSIREVRCIVDLDAESGRPTRPGGKENQHRIVVRPTTIVNFSALNGYLEGKADFDNPILEAINFLDHLLREYPSSKYSAIKRSFFYTDPAGRFDLGEGIEALKGVYQSMRIVHGGPTKARLSINVDVANGTFWNSGSLVDLTARFIGARDIADVASAMKQSAKVKTRYVEALKRLRKLHVQAHHRNGQADDYVIDRIVFTSANNHKIEREGKSMTLVEYYKAQYGLTIKQPDLPLIKATRGKNTLLPMELLHVKVNQRYPFKLNEKQTAKMITFAVEPPAKRMEAIKKGLNMLNWANDPVLKTFGMKIEANHSVVDSRLLPAPVVKFGQGEAKPGTSGRWDLRGKKFLQPNPAPLKSWGVCVITGRSSARPNKDSVENFLREFIKTYQNHGGRVENKTPALSLATGSDVGVWVTNVWNAAGAQHNLRPQILVFILPDKDSTTYGRIKRSCECRYGVVSQCMQYGQVQKCNGQYMSNVCLKFNAKLGGVTCRAVGVKNHKDLGSFKAKTLVIGADVSHAAPGSVMPSMAALTVSMNHLGTRYAAVCQTNGYRNEMIDTETFQTDVKPLVQQWIKNVNGGSLPDHLIYMRDGVSEGQYDHVLKQEVYDLREMIKDIARGSKHPTQFIAIVAGKRHHIRFFPEPGRGDRNGNPLPGTLVETGVTHPFENDFFMCSHAAIKGTARPVHYHVILNEARMTNEDLQTMLYEHSYQYIRATTPVSIHPAIYYAHIAANRAIPHDPKWSLSTESPQSQQQPQGQVVPRSQGKSAEKSAEKSGSSSGHPGVFERLMTMPNNADIQSGMWYI